MKKNQFEDYERMSAQEVLVEFKSSPSGLGSAEVKRRLEAYGANTLTEKKRFTGVKKFISHFASPLIIILLVAAIASFLMGESTDALIIACIVLFGVTLDFYQEYSADKALKRLAASVSTTTTVIRHDKKIEVKIANIVPGDIIFLSSGDMIPADARVISAQDFFVNQSSITGESFPVEKTFHEEIEKVEGKHSNVLFQGTSVVSGSAKAVIIRTGKSTEFGKIAQKLAGDRTKSDFEKGVTHFGFFLMKIILIVVVFIFFINSILKHDVFQSFMFAIAIAVGVTPELLPMIMSVTMTVGSKKMAKKGVIVKRLSAIPNFGGMNILCTDKTGTLTENKISLVSHTNYLGEIDESVLKLAYLNSLHQTGINNPLDNAVLAYKQIGVSEYKKIDEIPYDFYRKRMSVIVEKKGEQVFITKGAPEEMFKVCTHFNSEQGNKALDTRVIERMRKTYYQLSEEGYRVLGLATKKVGLHDVYTKQDEQHMVFEGFISFLDPPKKDVKGVIKDLHELGIEVKVITGDNELVTKKICKEVGLEVKGVLMGTEIDVLSEEALAIRAQEATIFARCSPDQKERIISALRNHHDVVGYMGDGINDAPSLKSADVGISVDTAVDIAKDSADLVLTRKSLRDLKEGVIEGRKTFGNTMKYVMMALSSNFGNIFSAAGAVIFLPFLPILPAQILLNNLIYDFSQVTIPSDKVDKSWVQKPKRWNLQFVKKFMYVFGPLSSLFDFLMFFVLYMVITKAGAALIEGEAVFQTGWFMMSLATQTLVVHVIRTKEMPFVKSRASALLTISTLLCVGVGWFLPYTALGAAFKFVPMPVEVVLMILGVVVLYLIAAEIAKRLFYRKYDF